MSGTSSDVAVYVPLEIGLERFLENGCRMRGVHGRMMLEPILAGVAHQRLQVRHFDHPKPGVIQNSSLWEWIVVDKLPQWIEQKSQKDDNESV